MGTWCGPDDPGNSHEPRSWRELLRAWFGNPVITPGAQAKAGLEREPEAAA